jgi:hypothetical protein
MDTKKKLKSKKPSIVVSHTAAGPKLSGTNARLVINSSFKDAERFSPRLKKFWAKVVRSGKGGLKVKTLDYGDQWSARFLIQIKALRDVPGPKEEKAATTKKSGKAVPITKTAKNPKKNNLAKAA